MQCRVGAHSNARYEDQVSIRCRCIYTHCCCCCYIGWQGCTAGSAGVYHGTAQPQRGMQSPPFVCGQWLRSTFFPQRVLFPAPTPLSQVASRSHMSQATRTFVDRLKSPTFESLGSSLKLVLVAEGRAALYPRMAPTNEWDTAAAHAIVLEAGGRVLQAGRCDGRGQALEDWEVWGVRVRCCVCENKAPFSQQAAYETRQEVVYNKEHLLNPFFVVEGRRTA